MTSEDDFAPIWEESILLEEHEAVQASVDVGGWLSAALDDPNVCDQMKADINRWFSAGFLYLDSVRQLMQADREAVRAEQAAELAKFKALAETLAGALEQFDQGCAAIGGCSDGYFVIQRPKGQHTNGGCRCSDDRNRMRRFAFRAAYFREKVAQALTSYKEQRDA